MSKSVVDREVGSLLRGVKVSSSRRPSLINHSLRILGVEFNNDHVDAVREMHVGAESKVGGSRSAHCEGR